MSPINQLDHHTVLSAMLAPALLMAATGSLLVSANARLARVVDRLRGLIAAWAHDAPDRSEREAQILHHRKRSRLVLRACWLLYAALGCFVGTSLAWRPTCCWASVSALSLPCWRCWACSAC